MNSIRKFYDALQAAGKGTIIALDSGARWVGVAVSDERRALAMPLKAVRRDKKTPLAPHIAQVMQSHASIALVMGLPLRLDGGASRETQRAEDLAQSLRKQLKVPMLMWDERFSSEAAARMMTSSPIRFRDAMMRHSIAAAWILEAVLQRLQGMTKDS